MPKADSSGMTEDLDNELQVIQSIYGNDALQGTDIIGVYILLIPHSHTSLRISFPSNYPESSPEVLGTEKIGDHSRKGNGRHVVDTAREILQKVFTPSSVCLFDLLQELDLALANEVEDHECISLEKDEEHGPELAARSTPHMHPELEEEPRWTLSTLITEKKSTFLARACSVKSPMQVKVFIAHLLDTDKRAAKATHNITAYRIRSPASGAYTNELTYQDCDDDGETAAGGRLLHLLQVMDVWNLLVVVSRWYGGVKLGPDRFSIINNVAREAIVEGGWTRGRFDQV